MLEHLGSSILKQASLLVFSIWTKEHSRDELTFSEKPIISELRRLRERETAVNNNTTILYFSQPKLLSPEVVSQTETTLFLSASPMSLHAASPSCVSSFLGLTASVFLRAHTSLPRHVSIDPVPKHVSLDPPPPSFPTTLRPTSVLLPRWH